MRRRFLNNISKSISDSYSKYFTIEALEDGLISSLSTNSCEYSLDGKTWINLSANINTPSINMGEKIYFRGNLRPTIMGIGTFTISKKCNVLGNCNSMLFGDNAESNLDLSGYSNAFNLLFRNCVNIIDASQLILPATTLADSCYCNMFYNCTSLVTAPDLPATNLASSCYQSMFSGCTSLITAPSLPATSLANSCYYNMFYGCSSLVVAPELPATMLTYDCYSNMFWGCTSLVVAPELPATSLTGSCYAFMFYDCTKLNYIKALFTTTPTSYYIGNWVKGVSSTGIFVKNKDATWNVTGVNGIPTGWTVITDEDVNNLISFTIDGITYFAEEGMTWRDWVDSEYNVDGYGIAVEQGLYCIYKNNYTSSNMNVDAIINNGDTLTLFLGTPPPGIT